jgi:hypothetical protein
MLPNFLEIELGNDAMQSAVDPGIGNCSAYVVDAVVVVDGNDLQLC